MLPILVSTMLSCSTVQIYDGDTVKLACPQEQKVRLCGIDAPESKQPLGKESRILLTTLLSSSSKIQLLPITSDKYKRIVGEVKVDGESVNEAMVESGLAYHYSKFSRNCRNRKELIEAEEQARAKKVGVWAKEYERPWEYRNRGRRRSRQKKKVMPK